MTSNLSNILRRWAELYRPISHESTSKGKAYYEVKTIDMQSEFVRNQNTAKSPCMAYSVLIDAEGNNANTVYYTHTIYFLSRAISRSLTMSAKQDDDLGTDQQLLMDSYVQDLLAYLTALRNSGTCPIEGTQFDKATISALRGLNIERAEWGSIPLKFGEWHIMALTLVQAMPRACGIDLTYYNI